MNDQIDRLIGAGADEQDLEDYLQKKRSSPNDEDPNLEQEEYEQKHFSKVACSYASS